MSKFPQKRQVNVAAASKRKHDLSHVHVTTTAFGRFKPIECRYMVPGDEFRYNIDAQMRALSNMPAPTFGDFKMKYRGFFVPIRSIWEHFYDFLANQQGQINGEFVDLVCPYTSVANLVSFFTQTQGSYKTAEEVSNPTSQTEYDFYVIVAQKYYRFTAFGRRIYDFLTSLGLNFPLNGSHSNEKINMFPVIAFWKFYFDWIVPSRFVQEHEDYIQLFITKMNSEPNYVITLSDLQTYLLHEPVSYFEDDIFTSSTYLPFSDQEEMQDEINISNPNNGTSSVKAFGALDVDDNISGSLANSSASFFNMYTLQTLGKLQDYLNRGLIAGHKVQDWLLTEFGLRPSDDALHLSTYLGKKEMTLQIESVLSTSDTEPSGGVALGSYGGYVNNNANFDFSYKSNEHGYFFITFELVPRTSYYQGLNPEFNMFDRLDFFQPEFDNQQGAPVSPKLIDFSYKGSQGAPINFANPFGFTLQYAPLKNANDVVSGDFRNRFGLELKSWFLTRNIVPNSTWRITEDWCKVLSRYQDWNYIFGDTNDDVDHWLSCFFIALHANRPMKSIAEGFEPTYQNSNKDVTLSFQGAAN